MHLVLRSGEDHLHGSDDLACAVLLGDQDYPLAASRTFESFDPEVLCSMRIERQHEAHGRPALDTVDQHFRQAAGKTRLGTCRSDIDTTAGTAEEIAARTVNKERARAGEAKEASKSSIEDISSGRRGGLRSHSGPGGRTRDQLYNEAKDKGVKGRSKMTKAQLERAVGR